MAEPRITAIRMTVGGTVIGWALSIGACERSDRPTEPPTAAEASPSPASESASSTSATSPATSPATAPAAAPAPASGTPSSPATIRFTERGAETGLDAIVRCGALPTREILEVNGGGVALLDHDSDGDLDVFVAVGATLDAPNRGPGSRLFRNDGGLRFTDVTAEAGIDLRGWATGVAVGDVDADGHDDLFVAHFGRDVLLRNRGDGTFEDITDASGLGDGGWATSAAFGDLDGDGDLDLAVVRYLAFDPAAPPARARFQGIEVMGGPRGLAATADLVYENLGDGRFADRSEPWGWRPDDLAPGFGLNLVIVDLDGDGRQDVYVGNDSTANHLWTAEPGTPAPPFAERALARGVATNGDGSGQATMGIAVGDVNDDGRPDLFSTNFSSDTNTLHESAGGRWHDDATRRRGLGAVSRPFLGWACWFADFDHDGDEDLLAVNGHVYPEATPALMNSTWEQPPLLFARTGARFERVRSATAGSWLDTPRRDRAAVFGDLDRDGDIDAVVTELNGPVRILENRHRDPGDATAADDWLVVALADRRPGTGNPRGLGAAISVTRGGITRHRWLFTGGGFQSASPPEVHVGVPGDGPLVVDVRWPDGLVQRVDLPAAGRRVTVERTPDTPDRPSPDRAADRTPNG